MALLALDSSNNRSNSVAGKTAAAFLRIDDPVFVFASVVPPSSTAVCCSTARRAIFATDAHDTAKTHAHWGYYMIAAIILQVLSGWQRVKGLEGKNANFSLFHRVRRSTMVPISRARPRSPDHCSRIPAKPVQRQRMSDGCFDERSRTYIVDHSTDHTRRARRRVVCSAIRMPQG